MARKKQRKNTISGEWHVLGENSPFAVTEAYIVTVSKQLGHASVSTTENYYSHIIDETKAKASECIAEVLLRRQA